MCFECYFLMKSEDFSVGMYAQRMAGLDHHPFAGDEMDAGLSDMPARKGERKDREDPRLGEPFSDTERKAIAARVSIRCEPEAAAFIREIHHSCEKCMRVDKLLSVIKRQLHRTEPGGKELLQGSAGVDKLAKVKPIQHVLHAGAVSSVADCCVKSDAGADTERASTSGGRNGLSDLEPAQLLWM